MPAAEEEWPRHERHDNLNLAAALWDFDGTLADTEPLWIAAEYDLISQLGGTWSEEHADQLVGNSLLDSGAYILNAIGRVDLSPAWVVDQLLGVVLDHIRRTRSSGARERSSCSTPSLRRVFRALWYRRRTACCWTLPSANCPRGPSECRWLETR